MAPAPLQGKVALVTGSTSGLGHAIASALAQQGCAVMLHGLESEIDAAPALLAVRAPGAAACGYTRADLAEPGAPQALVDATERRLGPVDVLVNNAVTRHFAPLEDLPEAAWQRALAVNVSAPFLAAQRVLPGMRRRGWGRIVNLTSVYGERGAVGRADYVTTKAALSGLTRAIAAEVAGQGITCNAITPGSVLTPGTEGRLRRLMADEGLDEAAATRRFLQGKQPVPRFVPAANVAQGVVFLCSEAAAEVNGIVLPMDHGWLAT